MRQTARLWCVALLAGGVLLAQQAQFSRDLARKIEDALEAERVRQGVVGLSAALAQNGVLVWSGGFGMADLEGGVPVRAGTVFRLGSIAKPITAVAALQLAAKGKLDLDAPIQKYVSSFPEKKWPITARLLLGHQAGIRHYKGDEISSTRHYTDLTAPLAIFAADDLLFEPGTKYSYTTYGYNLLGAAVEAAAGMRFMDYLRQNIFEPAGMMSIRDDDATAIVPNRTRFYRVNDTGKVFNAGLADTSNKIPGGGLVSTAEDLVRFALAVERGMLLPPRQVAEMWTPGKLRSGEATAYGYGWNVATTEGVRTISHSGGQQGTRTLLVLQPERHVALALMTNCEHTDLGRLLRALLAALPR